MEVLIIMLDSWEKLCLLLYLAGQSASGRSGSGWGPYSSHTSTSHSGSW